MSEDKPIECLVVGAGISGLTAATRLSESGIKTLILDKGRGVGGRMACRRMEDARLDHGAQFFTQRNPILEDRMKAWKKNGIIQEWYSTEKDTFWRGEDGMTRLPKYLAKNLQIENSAKVTSIKFMESKWEVFIEDGRLYRSNSLILTAPLPQACALIHSANFSISENDFKKLSSVKYTRCLAALLLLDRPSKIELPGIIKLQDSDVETIVDNQVKGISKTPSITLHSSPDFANEHWDSDNSKRLPPLIESAQPYINSSIQNTSVHRWGFAKTLNPISDTHYFMEEKSLALAGDGFIGGRVEAAMLSGLAAAESILSSR